LRTERHLSHTQFLALSQCNQIGEALGDKCGNVSANGRNVPLKLVAWPLKPEVPQAVKTDSIDHVGLNPALLAVKGSGEEFR